MGLNFILNCKLRLERVVRDSGTVAGVLTAQGFTTVAGALAGLIVVRALSTEAYARYSLALAVLGAITLLADSGTTTGALSQGGKVYTDPRRLGMVMQVARSLRMRFGLWAGGLALPLLAWLLWQHGASAWEVTGWIGVVGVLFVLNLRASLLDVPLKLHQVLRVTQGVAVGQSVLRLGAVAAGVCLWPIGVVAALAGGLPQAWANWRLARAGRPLVEGPAEKPEDGRPETGRSREAEMVAPSGRGPGATAEWATEPGALVAGEEANLKPEDGRAETGNRKPEFSDPSGLKSQVSSLTSSQPSIVSYELELRASIMAVVRRSLPGGIYYVVSQQAGLWFLSVGGTTLAVAQLGALSRIALLVGVVGALAQAVWVPRFARISDGVSLRSVYFRMLGYAFLLCLPLAALAAVWPTGLLWLVGPAYAGLESSLRLAVFAAIVQTLGGVSLQLVHGRGWLPLPILGIGIALAVQVACVWLVNVRTLDGVLWMGAALGLQTFVVHVAYLVFRTRRRADG